MMVHLLTFTRVAFHFGRPQEKHGRDPDLLKIEQALKTLVIGLSWR